MYSIFEAKPVDNRGWECGYFTARTLAGLKSKCRAFLRKHKDELNVQYIKLYNSRGYTFLEEYMP